MLSNMDENVEQYRRLKMIVIIGTEIIERIVNLDFDHFSELLTFYDNQFDFPKSEKFLFEHKDFKRQFKDIARVGFLVQTKNI